MELNSTNDTSSVEAVTRSAGSFCSYRSRSWGSRPRLYAVVRYAHCAVEESQNRKPDLLFGLCVFICSKANFAKLPHGARRLLMPPRGGA